MKTEIRNARILDPSQNLDEKSDLYFDFDGIISIGKAPPGWQADQSIDATGKWVLPGLVDIAVRLREPGQEQKATIASETMAALSAGVTSLATFPDTVPPVDSPAQVELIQQKARDCSYSNIHVIGALTTRLEGQTLTEMAALKESGCIGLTNAYQPLESTLVLRRAMEYAGSQHLPLFIQPIDYTLAANGCAHEGKTATRLGLPAIPAAAETAAVGQIIALVEQTNARTHFCRLSTWRGLQMIERAHHDGLPVSADLAIHQLYLTDDSLLGFDGNFHTIPPLRSQLDLERLRDRLNSPALQALCSDHQPHEPDAKLAPFAATQPGISSIEVLLPLSLELAKNTCLSLLQAIALITHKPAEILAIDAGTLLPGKSADLCVVDPALTWTVEPHTMMSAGKNCPFLGRQFTGKVIQTYLAGQLRFDA